MTDSIEQRLSTIENLLRQQSILQKEVLTLGEAASYLQVSASHVYKMTSGGILPHYCPTGKKLYFRRSELDQFLLSNRQATTTEIDQQAAEYITYKRRGGA